MNLKERRAEFEKSKTVCASAKLTFRGVDGYDVYNTSTPFEWQGRMYLFGRVERRADWARSVCRLFVNTGADDWTVVPDVIYPLEDPSVAWIDGQLVLVGTHVRRKAAKGRIVIANPFTACEEGTQTKGERQHVQRYVRNHPPE